MTWGTQLRAQGWSWQHVYTPCRQRSLAGSCHTPKARHHVIRDTGQLFLMTPHDLLGIGGSTPVTTGIAIAIYTLGPNNNNNIKWLFQKDKLVSDELEKAGRADMDSSLFLNDIFKLLRYELENSEEKFSCSPALYAAISALQFQSPNKNLKVYELARSGWKNAHIKPYYEY